ncbi:ATP-binding cassette domain-containing protein [Streptomyces sp. T1317-0309]|nr:ATP-binding cassette domain-containing protein [Streptomyces sp. T1317-0309]
MMGAQRVGVQVELETNGLCPGMLPACRPPCARAPPHGHRIVRTHRRTADPGAPGGPGRSGAGRVLREVSFDADPGRITVIVGSSGAGKSVLLQTLAGLRAPTGGRVLHDGAPPGRPGPRFGFVPQDDVIHRELPLRRTLVYAAGLRLPPGTAPGDIDERVNRVLDVLSLTDRADTPVGALSGGERKRASIAAELLTRRACSSRRADLRLAR